MVSINYSDKLSGDTPIFRISLLNFFLFFMALLQASSQLLTPLFITEDEPTPSVVKVWLSLGNEMAENWVAISLTLIFLVLGCRLYSLLSHKSYFSGNNLTSVGLLFINLGLCLRVYSNRSISEKIAYLALHFPTVVIIFIVVFFVIVGILVIQREQKNTKELDEVFYKENDEAGSKLFTEGGGDNNGATETDIKSDPEIDFQLKHPFFYAYRSFAKELDKKREMKLDHKKKLLQIKVDIKQKKKEVKLNRLQEQDEKPVDKIECLIGYISASVAFLFCIGLVIFLANQTGNNRVTNILKGIIDYILGITGILNDAKGPLTNFLLSSGVLFLFVILLLTFFLLVYFSIRVIVYLLSHPAEDTERIHWIGKAIKSFFLGILDGIFRSLFFLPDFLKCLEDMLLDTDMEKKIDEVYPKDKKDSK